MRLAEETDFSIVVEWENVILAEDVRCFTLLSRLKQQITQSAKMIEVIFLFNPHQIDQQVIETALDEYFHFPHNQAVVRVIPVPDKHYFELKNAGARHANGKIIVFLDSDVIIEQQWLASLISTFEHNQHINVMAGHTYLANETLLDKVMSLSWFFPLRNPHDQLTPDAQHFYANNVAFNKAFFLRHSFPQMPPGVTRGACGALAKALTDSGEKIWLNTGARAEHPAPANFTHLATRAMAEGRDHILQWGQPNIRLRSLFRESLRRNGSKIYRGIKRIICHGHEVDLKFWQLPVAALIIIGYYGLGLIGSWMALIFPRVAVRLWKI